MEQYFVRSRGKLAGPFDLAALQQLAKRGKLSRFDQLSLDKSTWQSAGDTPGVFAVQQRKAVAVATTATAPVDDTFAIEDSNSRRGGGAAVAGAEFFYAQNGVAVGPVALSVLQMLATNGTLQADDQVWADGSDIATPARQVPMLASMYTGARGKGVVRTSSERGVNTDREVPDSVVRTQSSAKISYFIVGGLVLLFSLLPVLIVNGRATWWWDGNSTWIALSLYAILAAVALVIVTSLAGRIARPVTALSLIACPLVFIFADVMFRAMDVGGRSVLLMIAGFGLVIVPVLVGNTNLVRGRLVEGGPISIRSTHIVLSSMLSLVAVAAIILLVMTMQEIRDWSLVPGLAKFVFACAWLGVIANLASGVLGIVSGKPTFTPALLTASSICLAVGLGCFILGLSAVGARLGATLHEAFEVIDADGRGAIAYAVMRVLILMVTALVWLGWSFRELLTWTHRDYALDAR